MRTLSEYRMYRRFDATQLPTSYKSKFVFQFFARAVENAINYNSVLVSI